MVKFSSDCCGLSFPRKFAASEQHLPLHLCTARLVARSNVVVVSRFLLFTAEVGYYFCFVWKVQQEQDFLTERRGRKPISQRGASFHVLYNRGTFWMGKCCVQFTRVNDGGLETQDNY